MKVKMASSQNTALPTIQTCTPNKNGTIFTCSIDFKKAFDSIWHEGLYYRLLICGIRGKMYDLVQGWATGGPRAACIPPPHLMRPANEFPNINNSVSTEVTLFKQFVS